MNFFSLAEAHERRIFTVSLISLKDQQQQQEEEERVREGRTGKRRSKSRRRFEMLAAGSACLCVCESPRSLTPPSRHSVTRPLSPITISIPGSGATSLVLVVPLTTLFPVPAPAPRSAVRRGLLSAVQLAPQVS